MYREGYLKLEKKMAEYKEQCLGSVVSLFANIRKKPLTIGNGTYYIVMYKGRYVPAYLDKDCGKFKPIYDEDRTHEFGWICFADVARIFDVIERTISGK